MVQHLLLGAMKGLNDLPSIVHVEGQGTSLTQIDIMPATFLI
jgi:hypothetical protein